MEIVFSVITQTDLYGVFFPAHMATTLNSPVFDLSWAFFEGRNPFCICVGDGIGSLHYSPLPSSNRLLGVDWQNKNTKNCDLFERRVYIPLPISPTKWCMDFAS